VETLCPSSLVKEVKLPSSDIYSDIYPDLHPAFNKYC
jgi:hypothetical protein